MMLCNKCVHKNCAKTAIAQGKNVIWCSKYKEQS